MKILIPLDGSGFSESVLKSAIELVESSGAEVHLLQVVKPAEGTADWGRHRTVEPHSAGGLMAPGLLGTNMGDDLGGLAVESRGQADERTRQEALDYLEHIIHEHFPGGATKVAVTSDDPAKAITEYAQEEKVSLIAMATHGRTGLARLILGSVAGKLLQTGVAPLYMVRPNELK